MSWPTFCVCLTFFYRTEAAALNETERATLAHFCQVLGRQLVPYMSRCLEALFPSSALSGWNCSSSLDVSSLQLLLEPFMPQETIQEKDNPRHDAEAETANQEKESGELVLSEEVSPQDESRIDVNEKIPDTEQSDLT